MRSEEVPLVDVIGWLNDTVPAKVPDLPGVDGTAEELLAKVVVISIPVLGIALRKPCWRWPDGRRCDTF